MKDYFFRAISIKPSFYSQLNSIFMIKKQDTHLLNWFDFYVHDITEKNNLFFSLEKKTSKRSIIFHHD